MKFSSTSIILRRQVNKIWFLVTSGCQLSRKVWKEKIEVFCRPEWTEVMNLQKNFKYFQIQKWMLQAGRAEKVLRLNKDVKEQWKYHLSTYLDEKNGVICVVFMFPSWIMILKLLKKVHFLNFVLTSAKKSNYNEQFNTYMTLEGLATHFWRY